MVENFALQAPSLPREGACFRFKVKEYATGEIRVTTLPAAATLDNKRKLQEYIGGADDACTLDRAVPGYGSLRLDKNTGEIKEGKFGSRAKQTLCEFGAAVDQRYGKNAVFFTFTLPGGRPGAFRALAEWSSYVVSRVVQWWRDHLPGAWYAWVWEYQKRGALHLHGVVADDDYVGLVRLLLAWKEFACDLLQQTSALAGVDLLSHYSAGRPCSCRAHVQMDAVFVQKSAAKYLAKYMGKSRAKLLVKDAYPPTRWWRVSNKALSYIRTMRDACEVRSPAVDIFSETLNAVVSHLVRGATVVHEYGNAWMPALRNWIFYTESKQNADELFTGVLEILRTAATKCGAYSGGGGTTNPPPPAVAGGFEGACLLFEPLACLSSSSSQSATNTAIRIRASTIIS